MRLIDADALLEMLPVVENNFQISLIGAVADFVTMICNAPTVDAVPIVRCGECKWASNIRRRTCLCARSNKYMRVTDFCSYGEREGDEI